MSRVGRLPIPLPKDVVVKIENGEVTVKGPKGELHRNLGSDISHQYGKKYPGRGACQ